MKQLYQFDSYIIDVANRTLFRDGTVLALKPKVFDTLLLLVEGKGNLLEKEKMITTLWGDTAVEENNLTQNISALRKILGVAPDGASYIETLPKHGYRFHAAIKEFWDEDDALVVEKYRRSHIVIEHKPAAVIEPALLPVEEASRQPVLEAVPAATSAAAAPEGVKRQPARQRLQVVGLALLGLIVTIITLWQFLPRLPVQQEEGWRRRLSPTIVQAYKQTNEDKISDARFSADGIFIAYSLFKGGQREEIWVTTLDGEKPRQVTEDEFYNFSPTWSPQKGELAYLSIRDGRIGIWKIPMLGGTPTPMKILEEFQEPGNPNLPRLIQWSKNSERIYLSWKTNLYWLEVATGQLTQVTSFAADKSWARGFDVSPDETWVCYADLVDGQEDIWRLPMAGGQATRVTNNPESEKRPNWHPDGARILYKGSTVEGINQICSVDVQTGAITRINFDSDEGDLCDISPDGTKFLYLGRADEADLWKVEVNSGKEEQLTADIGVEFWPSISSDAKTIAYQEIKGSHINFTPYKSLLLMKRLSMAGQAQQIADQSSLPQWSPDGKVIAFLLNEKEEKNIWVLDSGTGERRQLTRQSVASGSRQLFPFLKGEAATFSWSPDSTRIAYCGHIDGLCNLRVVDRDGANDTPVTENSVSNTHLHSPFWSADGKALAYVSDNIYQPTNSPPDRKVWVFVGGKSVPYLTTPEAIRLLGWLNQEEVLVATVAYENGSPYSAAEVSLKAVSAQGSRELGTLEKAFLLTTHLAPGGKSLAFVSTRDGNPNIYLLAVGSAAVKKVTDNREATVFFSSLAWSPDEKFLVYARQSREHQLTLMNNFQ